LDYGAPKSNAPGASWYAMDASSDGTKVIVTIYNGGIWCSTTSGATCTQTSAPSAWQAIASSGDGGQYVAVVYGGPIWISKNGGKERQQKEKKDRLLSPH